ncbi:MAG: hypothetical protein L0Z62_22865 [Gemmataceae bacterium]|nr:hypothetical protein [Gemmataceae bacterium]
MEYPHRIRLRGPWECEPLALVLPDGGVEPVGGPLPPPRRMNLPCRWAEGGLPDFAGRVRFVRRFGYPGQIDSFERVWLTFAGVEGTAEVRLNAEFLGRHDGAAGPFEHEVTALLQTRNLLAVEVEELTGRGGLWGEVALEVRRTAFLLGVRCQVEPAGQGWALHVTGEVAGTAERPLDLYVLHERSTVAWMPVPAGQPFRITAQIPEPARADAVVRVELVDAATVWDAVAVTLG